MIVCGVYPRIEPYIIIGGPSTLYAPPKIPEKKPKITAVRSVCNFRNLGCISLNKANRIIIIPKAIQTSARNLSCNKNKPTGIPTNPANISVFDLRISIFLCDLISRNPETISEITAIIGAAVRIGININNIGIATKPAPKPKVVRTIPAKRIIKQKINISSILISKIK